MDNTKTLDRTELAAAIDWWREAGVDCDFCDEATDWLAQEGLEAPGNAKPESIPAAPEPRQRLAEKTLDKTAPEQKTDLLGKSPPADLAAFRQWWLTEPGLDHVGPRGRVPPRGEAGAQVMILVTDPEQGDTERLLSQAQGRLLERMLSAMGLNKAEVYVASVVPRHWPMADAASLATAGYGAVLQHHIGLVAPQKVIALGRCIPPLLAHNAAQEPHSLREINHDGTSVPLMIADGLESMMAMPQLKARFWHTWLNWVKETQ